MSEAIETPAVEQSPVAVPEAAAPPAEPKEPAWLPERLARAKSTGAEELLKTAGFSSLDELKAAKEELQKLKESQLSEQERAQKERDALMQRATRAGELEAAVSAFAARELTALTDAQAQAVKAIAGEDPARILATIDSLKPTWAAAAAAPAPAPAPAAPATTAQTGGPPAAAQHSQVDHLAEFKRLKSTNPFLAQRYLAEHQAEISAAL